MKEKMAEEAKEEVAEGPSTPKRHQVAPQRYGTSVNPYIVSSEDDIKPVTPVCLNILFT